MSSNNPLVEKFTQLWFACYFEKRLTRQRIESADLVSIVKDLSHYFTASSEKKSSAKVDFRRAVPLLQGLHVLYLRKLALLQRDSTLTLKNMSEPPEIIKLEEAMAHGEDDDDNLHQNQRNIERNNIAVAKRSKNNNPRYNNSHRLNQPAIQLNPNKFDWFMSGID